MANMVNARKTHCDHGHEFTEENTGRTPGGHRFCKACKREIGRQSMAKARARARATPEAQARRRQRLYRILGLPASFWATTEFRDQGYRTPCVVWTSTIANNGYGVTKIKGRQYKAHRLAYESVNGPIPIDDETGEPFPLDHVCHSETESCPGGETCLHRRCINPDHLEPVTPAVNVQRGKSFAPANAAKTHCANGHEFTPENTGRDAKGYRFCLQCKRDSNERHEAKRTAARRAKRKAA